MVAKIAAIDPAIDQATRTLRVRATASNKKQAVLPGAFARINFLLDHTESALMVPTESLIPVLKGKKVFVVKKGVAQEVMVETGLRTEESIQVISGLQEGDTVVTKGTMQVKPGSQVKISGTKKAMGKK
jgi:membrane fusion protein (multidrug efflux system)